MRFTYILASSLAALASALPQPLQKRGVSDACALQPDGYGPVPNPATSKGFVRGGIFSTTSTIATTPSGYQRTFHNHLQSTSGNLYMGLYTLTTYDTAACASLCSNSLNCQGFNVFFERNPSLNPAPACPDPTPVTNYKCTLWGAPPTVVNATNVGEMRSSFSVVIAGSNGYAKVGTVSASLPDDGSNPYN